VKDFLDKSNTILSSFMDDFLKPLDKGHPELKICLSWFGKCVFVHEVSKK
jgi:hypothetical protein